jgi:ABC-type uncharacterized transport system fused permease/ATPase subunit
MIISIVVLSILLVVTIAFLASAIIHIKKIQNELEQLSIEQYTQNTDINHLRLNGNKVARSINDIAEYLSTQNDRRIVFPYTGQWGKS